ncbi:TetR/AcrR family transcriptional regulator C-terminal domain-containing protein [Amycolatopsis sp. NPDC059021]|uniref:TetR/AcrR family transcriptional regulator C-terminal domain-containing protein n=1 Tax=Amycolatopsis sp. NPDC059021 TaxID=3346704 RepID=UPI00366BE0D9
MARKGTLDREQITEAALSLLDEVGLAELSTRKLAARLGISSPTLYWHVQDKGQLLDLLAEAICADAFEIDGALPWREQLASGLRQFRALLLRHRDAATLLRERPPTGPHRLGHIETTVRILLDAGFSADETAGIARLLAAHVLASVEQLPPASGEARNPLSAGENATPAMNPEDYPNLHSLGAAFARLSTEDLFELGIDVVLDGLEHRRRRARRKR